MFLIFQTGRKSTPERKRHQSNISVDQIETLTSVNSYSLAATPLRHIRKNSHNRKIDGTDNDTQTVLPNITDGIIPSSTKLKVRTDRSAMVLVSIVILFVLTHSYRIALKVYEVASPNAHTIEKFKICFALKR